MQDRELELFEAVSVEELEERREFAAIFEGYSPLWDLLYESWYR